MRARHSLVRPEPLDDRPIQVDAFGDVWQRQGPAYSPTWYSAQGGEMFEFGRSWIEVWDSFGPLTAITRPWVPDPGYTTDSIPVVRDSVTVSHR